MLPIIRLIQAIATEPTRTLAFKHLASDLASTLLRPTSALNVFRNLGGAIRTQDWFKLWNTYVKPVQVKDEFKRLNLYEPYPRSLVSIAEEGQRERYNIKFQYEAISRETGKVSIHTHTFTDTELHLPAWYEARFAEYKNWMERLYGINIGKYEQIEVREKR